MSEWPSEFTLFTRYAAPDRSQYPVLRQIDASLPHASFCGPLYPLNEGQIKRQRDLHKPYATTGSENIAKELQDECEQAGRVIYPLYVESDVYLDDGPDALLARFREFVEDRLGIPFGECTLYFSGNRSIHAHVPRFVVGEDSREAVKAQAERFNEETDAELDTGIYSRKRQFRLPGATHASTQLQKVRIDPEWSHDRIVRAASTSSADPALPFAPDLVGYDRLTRAEPDRSTHDVDPVLNRARTAPEFSPYAGSRHGDRSVAAVKVLGGAFARKGVRDGATLVPAYFYAARGCGGRYTKHGHYAPLQLSERDYAGWDHNEGDIVVVIGGQSRNSRIFEIAEPEAVELEEDHLHPDHGSRGAALSYLSGRGCDVGAAGPPRPDQQRAVRPVADGGTTRANALKQRAETEGVDALSRIDQRIVANRLLRIDGWGAAWDWFESVYGSQFDSEVTRRELNDLIETYPDLDPPDPD